MDRTTSLSKFVICVDDKFDVWKMCAADDHGLPFLWGQTGYPERITAREKIRIPSSNVGKYEIPIGFEGSQGSGQGPNNLEAGRKSCGGAMPKPPDQSGRGVIWPDLGSRR